MITQFSHVTIFVHNQDDALEFYTKKLGFVVHTDAAYGPGLRWLTVSPVNKSFQITLMYAETPQQKALVGTQAADMPFCVFETDDCKADCDAMKKAGVEFVQEPTQQPWGIEALFKDLYGNILDLVQR